MNLEINEAVLTGESLPKEKKTGDAAYSGSVVATALAVGGVFVAPIPFALAAFVWVWAFFWMQVSELVKTMHFITTGAAVRPAQVPAAV